MSNLTLICDPTSALWAAAMTLCLGGDTGSASFCLGFAAPPDPFRRSGTVARPRLLVRGVPSSESDSSLSSLLSPSSSSEESSAPELRGCSGHVWGSDSSDSGDRDVFNNNKVVTIGVSIRAFRATGDVYVRTGRVRQQMDGGFKREKNNEEEEGGGGGAGNMACGVEDRSSVSSYSAAADAGISIFVEGGKLWIVSVFGLSWAARRPADVSERCFCAVRSSDMICFHAPLKS